MILPYIIDGSSKARSNREISVYIDGVADQHGNTSFVTPTNV